MSGSGYNYGQGQYYQPVQQEQICSQSTQSQGARKSTSISTPRYPSVPMPTSHQPAAGYQDVSRYRYTQASEDPLENRQTNVRPQGGQPFRSNASPTLDALAYKSYNSGSVDKSTSLSSSATPGNLSQNSSHYGVAAHYQSQHTPAAYTPVAQCSYTSAGNQLESLQNRSIAPNSFAPAQSVRTPVGVSNASSQHTQAQPVSYQHSIVARNTNLSQQNHAAQAQRTSSTQVVSAVPTDYAQQADQVAQQRHEPTEPITVDPNQVYDSYHEYQRQTKRAEAEAAARAHEVKKVEDQKREQEEAREAAREIALRDEQSAAKARQSTNEAHEAQISRTSGPQKCNRKSNGTQDTTKRSNGKRAKAAVATTPDQSAQAAALTLMSAANSESNSKQDLEAEMRAMFLKMREFNAKDPDLLSKLWEQERDEHIQRETGASQPPLTAVVAKKVSVPQPTSKPPAQSKKGTVVSSIQQPPSQQSRESLSITQPVCGAREEVLKPAALSKGSIQASTNTNVTIPAASQATTIWPAERMATLAAAASDILPKMPQNSGKSISSEEVMAMLAKNPSYEELCDKIQALGFVVNRKTFAKALLAAVPDVNAAHAAPTTIPVGEHGTGDMGRQQNVQSSDSINPLRDAESRLLNTTNPVVESPSASLDSINASKIGKGSSLKAKKVNKKRPAVPERPSSSSNLRHAITGSVVTKKSNTIVDPELQGLDAVKQFVDTAPLVDDTLPPIEDFSPQPQTPTSTTQKKKSRTKVVVPPEPPTPATKQELARKRTFGDLVDLTQLVDEDPLPFLPAAKKQEIERHVHQLPSPPNTVIEPELSFAAQPRTLSQLHPPIQPAVKGPRPANFESLSSLLSQPMPQAVSTTSLPTIPFNHPARTTRLVQPLDKYKAIRRSTYDAKTIARDVLIACGRHPDMRHLNSHLETLKQAFGVDNTADLSTFRWDVVDPGGPPPGSGNPQPVPEIVDEAFADDEDDDTDSVLNEPRSVRQAVGAGGEIFTETASRLVLANVKTPAVKRRPGRPPRSAYPLATPTDANERPTPRGSKPISAPPTTSAATPDTGGIAGYSALHAAAGTDRKKGRPVGWRKWMQKTPSSVPPKKPTVASTSTPEPQPEYKIYKCGWQDCRAELHNLATLRKHIHRLHLKKAAHGGYDCLWAGCGKVKSVTDKATNRVTSKFEDRNFDDEGRWKEHVEKEHISPIAWELGDGPAGGVSGELIIID